MKAKTAILFGNGRFVVYSSENAHRAFVEIQKGYPEAKSVGVFETTDASRAPNDKIVGRLGNFWYIEQ